MIHIMNNKAYQLGNGSLTGLPINKSTLYDISGGGFRLI